MILYSKPSSNFTMVSNEILHDSSLTLQARAIYALMRSYGKNWRFNAKYLAKVCAMGVRTFYKYITELLEHNLIKRVQVRTGGKGFYGEVIYIFSDANEIVEADIDVEKLETKDVKAVKNKTQEAIEKLNKKLENAPDKVKKAEVEMGQMVEAREAENAERCGMQDVGVAEVAGINNIYSNKNKKYVGGENQGAEVANKTESKEIKTRAGVNYFGYVNLKVLLEKCNKVIRDRKARELEFQNEQDRKDLDFRKQLDDREREAYDSFMEYRQEKKKLSDTTKTSIQKRFIALKEQGEDMSEVVNRSITNGWTGIFPLQKSRFNNLDKIRENKFLQAKKQKDVFKRIFGTEQKSMEEMEAELMAGLQGEIDRVSKCD